ncbi:MAG TPA: hypothetical protein VEB40_08685 [Flavipsychrobacter sp.]|nr:hypothetical protein [Flavipsychrobacter sp.]
MSNQKKSVGRQPMSAAEKKKLRSYMLPPELIEWLETFPPYKRSKVVTNSLHIYKAVLEGKVSFDETKTDPQLDLTTLLHS